MGVHSSHPVVVRFCVSSTLSAADSLSFWPHVPERILLPRGQDRLIYDGAPPDLFVAAGRYNQRLYVIPSRQMVVVRLGRADRTWSDGAVLACLLDGTPR
jgi:CubicO group peptidase (beta-lactamase class C family)